MQQGSQDHKQQELLTERRGRSQDFGSMSSPLRHIDFTKQAEQAPAERKGCDPRTSERLQKRHAQNRKTQCRQSEMDQRHKSVPVWPHPSSVHRSAPPRPRPAILKENLLLDASAGVLLRSSLGCSKQAVCCLLPFPFARPNEDSFQGRGDRRSQFRVTGGPEEDAHDESGSC